MYLDIDRQNSQKTALRDSEGHQATYGDIAAFSEEFRRVIPHRALVFVLSGNCVDAALGYLGAMINRIVPLMLGASMDGALLDALIDVYRPEYLWKPADRVSDGERVLLAHGNYVLTATGFSGCAMYEELSLLLTTSGSTGSPKLVRHSYRNLESQARNISAFFRLDDGERAMLDLPIHYTYGLSILNSHLYAGATVLLTSMNLLNPQYWRFLKEEQATSFTNVPYAYEILKKLRVARMDLPSLKTFSQGGGKLGEALHREFARFAADTGRRFIVTYGQTEGSARMAYLPPEYALEKCGSIGRAIPGGRLYLLGEDGTEINAPGESGEMVYEGPNVTLGYAHGQADLALGDERQGVLHTGDIAYRDEDGFFYIVGRKKRFLKLWGYRVGLDECEGLIRSAFDTECACVGSDEAMDIYVTTPQEHDIIKRYIAEKTNIHSSAFRLHHIAELPRNEAGKVLYAKLMREDGE